MKQIPLRARDGSVRAYAIVDDSDFDWLNQWRWSLHKGGYAGRKQSRTLFPAQPTLLMHRQILGLEPGDVRTADHINHDPLDNRRTNLRIATRAENCQNTPSRAGSTSRHRGVFWDTRARRWCAKVQVNYRAYTLGHFDDEEEAARVAAAFRAEHMPFAVEEAVA